MPLERIDDALGRGASASDVFTDRVQESGALAGSIRAHQHRVWTNAIDAVERPNVLVYYGVGGMGKSALSRRLHDWIQGNLAETCEWGPPPTKESPLCVRWDLAALKGELDSAELLVALRSGIAVRGLKWRAFDLALAAFLAYARPGQVALPDRSGQMDDFMSVLAGIATELGMGDFATAMGATAVKSLVGRAIRRHQQTTWMKRLPLLGSILEASQSLTPGETAEPLVADILWLLTQQIDMLPPTERPLLVIFVDHFEKLKSRDAVKAEVAMNRFMAQLPHALFVVTGRNRLDWHAPDRHDLVFAGSEIWSQLGATSDNEPRQHLLGRLAPDDALQSLVRRSQAAGVQLGEHLMGQIVEASDGFPLHLDALYMLCVRKLATGQPVRSNDLTGGLPKIVERLLNHMPVDQARAFMGACLVTDFDVPLAAALGGVDQGSVRRCISNSLAEESGNSIYPYRIHEQIRDLVRLSRDGFDGGWAEGDWHAAATRGLQLAASRFDEAMRDERDAAATKILSLSLSLALREGVNALWLPVAVDRAPTMGGLATHLPEVAGDATSEPALLIRLVHAVAGDSKSAITHLRKVASAGGPASCLARKFLAYRLRQACDYDGSREELRLAMDSCPANRTLLLGQTRFAYLLERRFADALEYNQLHCDESERFKIDVARRHGALGQSRELDLQRISTVRSRRFRLELTATQLRYDVLEGHVDLDRLADVMRALLSLGDVNREIECLTLAGMLLLDDAELHRRLLSTLGRAVHARYGGPAWQLAEVLALRARLTRDPADVERAHAYAAESPANRSSLWIHTEVILDDLGHPLSEVPGAQWLQPDDQVKEQWLAVADRVIDQARGTAHTTWERLGLDGYI